MLYLTITAVLGLVRSYDKPYGLCRRHHQAKQTECWQLDQPEPGVLVWRLPHGRSYRVEPDCYP
jgi:hypothetical protein